MFHRGLFKLLLQSRIFAEHTHLAMKAAATVLIFECLMSATTVNELPTIPTIMVIRVMTPAAVNITGEYLEKKVCMLRHLATLRHFWSNGTWFTERHWRESKVHFRLLVIERKYVIELWFQQRSNDNAGYRNSGRTSSQSD